jgi:hypothetical protein
MCIQLIRLWYKKNQAVEEDEGGETIKSLGLGQQWNLCHVVWFKMKLEINQKIVEVLGEHLTKSDYIGAYQKATNKVIEELSEDQTMMMNGLASKWNSTGPPDEIKRMYIILSSV